MHDALLVDVAQGFCHLCPQLYHFIHRESLPFLEYFPKILPLNEGHRQIRESAFDISVDDLYDMIVLEWGQGPRFPFKPLQGL